MIGGGLLLLACGVVIGLALGFELGLRSAERAARGVRGGRLSTTMTRPFTVDLRGERLVARHLARHRSGLLWTDLETKLAAEIDAALSEAGAAVIDGHWRGPGRRSRGGRA